MPQFEPTWFASQIFWLVVIFWAFYWLMTKKILPRATETFEARRQRIEGDLDTAKRLREEADAAMTDYEARIAEARTESQSILREAAAAIKKQGEEAQESVRRELDAESSKAEKRIATAKREALDNVRMIALEAATAATGRLVGDAVDTGKIETAVDSRLKEAHR